MKARARWERACFSTELRKKRSLQVGRQPPWVTSLRVQRVCPPGKLPSPPSAVVERLERLVKKPLCMFGDIGKKAEFVTVVSGEMSVRDDRQRGIVIVRRQPCASGWLALSCRDNRISSPTSRQRRQMAASSYWSHLSPQPRIIPQVLQLKWRSGAQRTGVTLQAGRRDGDVTPSGITDAVRSRGWAGSLAIAWPSSQHPPPRPAPRVCRMSKVRLRQRAQGGRPEPGGQGDARCLRGATRATSSDSLA